MIEKSDIICKTNRLYIIDLATAKRTPKPKIALFEFYYHGYFKLNFAILLNHGDDVVRRLFIQ